MHLKRLDIKAIEFDWIFNKDASQFITALSKWRNIEVFSLDIIKWVILFCWQSFKNYILYFLFLPYLAYFILFIMYATYFNKKKTDDENQSWEYFGIANSLWMILLLPFIFYFAFLEFRQLLLQKNSYYNNFWNLVDMSSIILNSLIILFDLINVEERTIVLLFAWAVLLMWLKLFYFGRIFFVTASGIRMIIDISWDMRYFLLILVFTITGFGNSFMILARNYDTKDMFTGNNYWRSFLYSYRQALGDFDTDAYIETDEYYLYALWFLNTMVTLIIFLNLLIAIMGDTFDRVQEHAENNMLRELAIMMVENEFLFNRSRIFKDAKYIIVAQEEKTSGTKDNWEGKMKYLKNVMDKNVYLQSKSLEKLRNTIQTKTDDKMEQIKLVIETFFTSHLTECNSKYQDLKNHMQGRYRIITIKSWNRPGFKDC